MYKQNLALNNLQRLICHKHLSIDLCDYIYHSCSYFYVCVYIYIYIYIYIYVHVLVDEAVIF